MHRYYAGSSRSQSTLSRRRRSAWPPYRTGLTAEEEPGLARLHELFRYLKDHDGSDLHLGATMSPRIRVHGEIEEV